MAIVTVNLLHCGVTYNIIAGGMHNNGTLVGPGSSYGNITTGACPLEASEITQLHMHYDCRKIALNNVRNWYSSINLNSILTNN